ncbi:MAG: hypothetical protein EA355_08775 [Rhodobacteraceae bacterium]|nr:MAG: hypothetical protein EA355_08775 [Paracoccaceae bacterium]
MMHRSTFLSLLIALAAVFAARADLPGVYIGVGEAQGMRVEMSADGAGLQGAITLGDGERRTFRAERAGETAEAAIETGDGSLWLHFAREAVGVVVTVIPFDAEGALRADRAQALAFVREGVALPDAPERFLPPPTAPVRVIDARAFVSSYPFWPPMAAAWGWEGVEPRFRSVIRMFPLIQADILWTLCRAPQRTAGLGEALDGQGVTCEQVVSAVRQMQVSGAFDRFKRDVAQERRVLMTVLGCARDLTRQRPECARAGAETAKRAISMETAATALARYR